MIKQRISVPAMTHEQVRERVIDPIISWPSAAGFLVPRAATLARNVSETISSAHDLSPPGIVLVKQNVFDLLEQPLRAAGLPLLHDAMIPFPGSGQWKRFPEGFAQALTRLPGREKTIG